MTFGIRTVKEQRETLRRRNALAQSFVGRLKEELAGDLLAVVLFDWVFGPSDPEDVQVIVITESPAQPLTDRVFEIANDLTIENGSEMTLTPKTMSGEELERHVRAGFPDELQMLREGDVLYDTGFFQRIRTRELSKGGRNAG
jgi:hypothetical protein